MEKKQLQKIKYQVTKQLKELKDDLLVISDTREKENANSHILHYFNKYGWEYQEEKLDTGDYSFVYRDEDYTERFTIDRKRLDEFIGNFCETKRVEDSQGNIKKIKKERFEKELLRMEKFDYAAFAIENSKGLYEVYKGIYRSKMNKNAALGKVHSIKTRGIHVDFIDYIHFSEYVLQSIYYYLRRVKILEELKK